MENNNIYMNAMKKIELNKKRKLLCCYGPTGPTGPETSIENYGGIYGTDFNIITIDPNSSITLPLDENMAFEGVTLGGNAITILSAGDYKIDSFVGLDPSVSTFGIQVGVFLNNIEIPSTYVFTPIGDYVQIISTNSIVSLSVGDVLTLQIFSVTGGDVSFVDGLSASLTVFKLNN